MDSKTFKLSDSLGYTIVRTAKVIRFGLRNYFRNAGLDVTSEQWALLCHLWEKEGYSQKELAQRSFRDTANITRMIDVLEDRGVLYREKDPKDRRTYRIYLTRKGRDLKGRLMPIVQEEGSRAYSCLTEEEQMELLRMLNKLCNHIQKMQDNG